MSERSNRISKLLKNQDSRVSYIKSKLAVLVPAQIRALRLKSTDPAMPFQRDLARESDMQQSRISMFETPGVANMTLETIAKIAAGLRVGVIIKFVPFNQMLRWENSFSPDSFNVTRLAEDREFLNPPVSSIQESPQFAGLPSSGWDDLAYADFEDNETESIGFSTDNQQTALAGGM
jgi:transcriptional regulator with XRE-family HTH domain